MQVKYHFGIERVEIRFITWIITKNIYSFPTLKIIKISRKLHHYFMSVTEMHSED